jgi:hypothetical protein
VCEAIPALRDTPRDIDLSITETALRIEAASVGGPFLFYFDFSHHFKLTPSPSVPALQARKAIRLAIACGSFGNTNASKRPVSADWKIQLSVVRKRMAPAGGEQGQLFYRSIDFPHQKIFTNRATES